MLLANVREEEKEGTDGMEKLNEVEKTSKIRDHFQLCFWGKLSTLGTRWYHKAKSDSGQGVAEYVIILAVIVIACIILAIAFHEQLTSVWESITQQLGAIV